MRAIILAAGMGSRLGAITERLPKPLVQVNNKPIIQYQLEALYQAGINHCTIVLGYLGHQLREHLGNEFGGVNIQFVENPIYKSTNNIYSLWLALRESVEDDIILLEGDLIFDPGLISDLVDSGLTDVAVVDKFSQSMNGTAILAESGYTSFMVLKDQQASDFDYENALKTVNIYVLSNNLVSTKFFPAVSEHILEGNIETFYESVLSELIQNRQIEMAIHPTWPRKWIEIDTTSDLAAAQQMFYRC